MKFPILFLVVASTWATAQSTSTEFPTTAEQLSAEKLTEELAGKVYGVQPTQGPKWRWQFNSNGYFYINIGEFSDGGKWSAKGSSLCSEGKKITASCNEIRKDGSVLYLKRDSGEIVKMLAQ